MNVFKLEETPLPDFYKQTAARYITSKEKLLLYKRIDKGQYKMYCPFCQNYKMISYSELKDVQKKKMNEYGYEWTECPICKAHFNHTSNMITHKIYTDYIYVNVNGKELGYQVVAEFNFGEPIKYISSEQFAQFTDDEYKTYIRCGYGLSTLGQKIIYDDSKRNGYWRVSNSVRYGWHTDSYLNGWTRQYGTRADKKMYCEQIYHITKSNQQKMVMQYNCDPDMSLAVGIFNLNNISDLEKYKRYIKKNAIHFREWRNEKLNVFYLDYLSRNDIDLGNYHTYAKNLEVLGFKLDKPTNFEYRYEKIDEMVKEQAEKELNEKIISRFESLPKYESDAVSIKPFSKASEIRYAGKTLHNCIGGYVSRYANKATDIYRVDVNGRLTAALEITRSVLWQARADHNAVCSNELMEHIRAFCKANNINPTKA